MLTYIKDNQESVKGNDVTLLEQVIYAIPANQRSKVVLPLDIIGYLIKKSRLMGEYLIIAGIAAKDQAVLQKSLERNGLKKHHYFFDS